MRNRPDYGDATPEDLARALFRPIRPRGRKEAARGRTAPAKVTTSDSGRLESGTREGRSRSL